jgi:pimeloyl-ACP methyl ester carboxylesterase
VDVPPDDLWTLARQFCGDWHPFIEWAKPERDAGGHLVRVFKVKGEEQHYRERLTYFSDADREFHYCHVEGIRDAISYKASLHIIVHGDSSVVEWQAELEAPEPRASEIAKGTEVVFQAGIDALAEAAFVKTLTIADGPALTVDHTAYRPGPLLLFLHGIGGNRSNWRRQLLAAGRTHQAAALDFRGYGGSALGASQSTIDDHCNDILRVMAAFHKDKVILCGMSLGSWIATSFAMRHPEKLSGLILSGGCTGMSEAPKEVRDAFLAARQKPLDAGLAPKDFADDVVEVIAGPQASTEALQLLRESMASIPAATYRDALWCFTHPKERFDFARIPCPVLMMTGEHDRLASPAEIRSVAQRIHDTARNPDVTFEIIPAAGHLCNIESPAAYNHHLTHFLRRLAP